ncbi:formyltetrahydrofolate deformylase [Carbonactinospora thermoautotrophica]|uniref:Formyltetrahydrofolate deformylase n=1 Tax=Carbonactinospora thermoautotrophica TaxID=1469144 RepID=A0A132MYG4_9ACTN|nr:formyltetrahydrofolate deformylase [Carbonactinospora thermoautotrophica]KWW98126.1 formyltetrahydrofolate deformylase [Carbonactinospora thermoautotrophica]KWX02863.1 Formyltetrahydrofolate deformylase [Carbonactinospora thermoautotrophica]KWX10254.1 formyltetrahydrofolate deformylase [Carbonactinospora thermoautotrophica]MCX9192709.1 formyltetrahydrofolate deformylase [Carbonactinospora thermoautotrophica]
MTEQSAPPEYVLTLSCPDRRGIVHAVSSFLLVTGCNILDSQQFGDRQSGLFFMRVHFAAEESGVTLDSLRAGFEAVGASFHMNWQMFDASAKSRVMILVSKFGHCLNDLLFRYRIGALPIEIPVIVSNHEDFRSLAESYGIPYCYLPVTKETKAEQEARIWELVEEHRIDLVVLARYMQILSDDLCKKLEGRAINIHHSFLPSFKGAKPYHQAHARGVKLIGATAHYVTADLDEGPIIEQEVARVDHSHSPDQLVAVGRDIECQVLARAVKWHVEHRVLLNGHRTVVFA